MSLLIEELLIPLYVLSVEETIIYLFYRFSICSIRFILPFRGCIYESALDLLQSIFWNQNIHFDINNSECINNYDSLLFAFG